MDSASLKPGIYRVHKPVGPSSFAVMRGFVEGFSASRKLKVCHGGTLDPFAEGLLLVLVGPLTRVMDLLHEVPKEYVAEVAWGVETDTGDLHGRPQREGDASHLTPALLDAALSRFVGWTEQVPPPTSAKKIGGEPAYRKVHRGEEVSLPPSRVYLHEAQWLSHDLPRSSRLQLSCRGGYYVRALARDLGRALGSGAHLARLQRARIGPWEDPGPERWEHLAGEALLPWLRVRVLSDAEMGEIRRERPIPLGKLGPPGWRLPEGFPPPRPWVRAVHQGRLVALLEPKDGEGWPIVSLGRGA